ncbi:tetratricopeptide repeat protein [Notoacmeibacter sp. MSK16QG-6]|uniref:tetratricopeptide repeat protein n=1 Tax=Notoacmeibacter sp. MSK16QG-6 TaxID=2957982 RepID=UPI0020A0641E|nr:sel1 repeat family protein [Notoacmeibacter sp. MSK16QG-6]MCP1199900.1 sel1 repeat family protein [Notoacmeibacter sp. MSK16QG-6]
MKAILAGLCAVFLVNALHAEPVSSNDDDMGSLNPPDTGPEMLARKIEMGAIDSVTCSLGFNAVKYDNHELARRLAIKCAEAGYAKAMMWISQLENNGPAGEYNPDASAEWDRRAAEAGDPVGQFNHGLNLMRGHGIARDEPLGRSFIDKAADEGIEDAIRLRDSGYDLDEVTPDADKGRYGPLF